MQFKEGTTVYTADNEKVGDIERFVVDPRAEEIIGLVVRKGFWLSEDKVIPLNAVADASAERVTLRDDVSGPDDFAAFEEVHYVTPPEDEFVVPYTDNLHGPLYHYPPLGWMGWRGTVYPPAAMKEPRVERNIPDQTVAVREGANVITRDGEGMGKVEQIITVGETNMVTHFVVSKGLPFFKKHRLVPTAWVTQTTEDSVFVGVTAKTMEALPEYEPEES